MDANEVLAAAQQAVVSSVEQSTSSPAAGAANETSTKTANASNSTPKPQVNGIASASSNSAGSSNSRADDSSKQEIEGNDDDEAEEGAYMEEGEVGEMSFVIDTAGDMDVDQEIALEDEAKAEQADTHVEAGLLLPSHVNVIPQGDNGASQPGGSSSGPSRDLTAKIANDDEDLEGDMGDFEQLDMDPSTANRYYGAEEKAERRAKEQCLACGELGHDRRHCPHQHCLACGAMDDHPTRFCPMSTSCFRCGGMGHQTRTCPKPRRGPRSEECERCGSYTHVKTLCPTLWRVYTYSTLQDYDRFRAKAFFKLQHGGKARDPRRDLEPDPAEISDSDDEFVLAGEPELPSSSGASQFDPATRWCYNCSTLGNHWGDDCPEPRCNPTRGTNEPSAFSEFVSRLGPFAKMLPGAPPLAGFQMPSSQFTFSVGSSATMHVAGDAVASSSGRSTPTGKRGAPAGGSLAIGRHTISSPRSSRADTIDKDGLVSFGRTKAVPVKGGYLTRKEQKQGKKPLPEHLFVQWLQDRQDHPEFADKIRNTLEKRARLERSGQDTKDVPTTQDIVRTEGARRAARMERRQARREERESERRKGEKDDPIEVDSDSSYRDDFSSDSDSDDGRRGKKRRGDGKNSRNEKVTRSQREPVQTRSRDAVHTGWGHNGDGGSSGGRGSNGSGSGKGYKGGRFSSKKERYENGGAGGGLGGSGSGGGKKRGRSRGGGGGKNGSGGGGGGGNGGRPNRNSGGGGGGGGGEKVRGGGSKYRGSYF